MKTGLLLALLASASAVAAEDASHGLTRYAVIVGSNKGVGERPALRYSHHDAESMAQVLVEVGQFKAQNVAVLLDPSPAAVLRALDAALLDARSTHGKAMLLFYYSGHADGSALYPNGEALALSELKQRLSSTDADLRIGIIDACRGGGWTQAKGLTPTEPFAIGLPQLESEGTALLAASSGIEDAHETESLQGSFFTHHLVAGLRGAGDTSKDGRVSLTEAFAYADERTIRDTAEQTKEPQHPSYELNLRGRQDVVLTSPDDSKSGLTLQQQLGPLQVVQLATGDIVVEAPAGEHQLRVALPAGDYLVRRIDGDQVLSRKVTVGTNLVAEVDEASLELIGTTQLTRKGVEAVEKEAARPERFEVSFSGEGAVSLGSASASTGSSTASTSATYVDASGAPGASLTWRFGRRWSWRVARFRYELRPQLVPDIVAATSLVPLTTFTLESGLVFSIFRGQRLPSGLQFEVAIGFGPEFVMYRVAGTGGTLPTGGASIEGWLDVRLPFATEISVRPYLGYSVYYAYPPPHHPNLAIAGDFTTGGGVRAGLALAWRFGGP